MRKSAIALMVLLLLALIWDASGCAAPEETPTLTPMLITTPTSTLAPTSTPVPAPTAVSKVFNITRTLSGLSITITVVSWTGNEAVVEWAIENHTGQVFEVSRLYSCFYPGACATDQAGNEGEYFVPSPITQDIGPGDFMHYETRWFFFPESAVITIRLADVYQEGGIFVDTSTEFIISR